MDQILKKINKQNVQDLLSLTPMQEGLLFHYLNNPDSSIYFEQLSLKLSGNIDVDLMQKTWNQVVEANEMLRTIFRWENLKNPMQIILKSHQIPFRVHDLSGSISPKKEQQLLKIQENDLKEKIDISSEPLRVTLVLLSDNQAVMIISNHHILYDGWSNGIILREFFQFYNAQIIGQIPEKVQKNTFKEFIRFLKDQDQIAQKNYWMNYLEGFDRKAILPVLPETDQSLTGSRRYLLALDEEVTNQIHVFVRENRITIATLFYYIWGILLQRYNNTGDVVFGTTVSGRNADIRGLEEMVGLFINTIPLRVKGESDKSNLTLLGEVDRAIKERTTHENVPLVDIKSCSAIDPQEPLFDSIVVIENYPLDQQLRDEKNHLQVESYSMQESTNFDLTLAIELNNVITLQFVYNPLKLNLQLIQRLAEYFNNILTYILEKPDTKVSEIEMLSDAEKDQLIWQYNDTALAYPQEQSVAALIEEWAIKVPDQVAVQFAREQITYGQLWRQVGGLASTLRGLGVKRNQPVAILAERSIQLIVGILGILRAGGAYVPINPTYPEERISYMLEDSGARVLLTHTHLQDQVSFTGQIVLLEDNFEERPTIGTRACGLDASHNSKDLAYIIYTSGSTGKPKGVMVPHRALNNYLYSIYTSYDTQLGIADKCLSQANISFDASVVEIFLPLAFGATLVLFNNEMHLDIQKMARLIIDEEITFALIPPMILKDVYQLLSREEEKLKLDKMLVGIEPIQDYVLADYLTLHPNMQILNGYGPTETTICSSFYKYLPSEPVGRNVPIGLPLGNTQIYILDQNQNLVPYGATGELCISGDGVANGYLNKRELTAEKFVPNPFIPGKKMYKTGDLARWSPDGNLEFIGRIDHQVKIRGFRIEPGEIENQLLNYQPVNEAIVIDREDQNGDKYLVAYLVADEQVTGGELREYLLQNLPQYMIPSYFTQLEEMPLNPNGKVDRKALPTPDAHLASVLSEADQQPTTETEIRLAKIWTDVLGIDEIGIHTSFFAVGGQSLNAIRIVTRIQKEFQVEVQLKEFFQYPTVYELARVIERGHGLDYIEIESQPKAEYYQVSLSQKRLWILDQLEGEQSAYIVSHVHNYDEPVQRRALEEACQTLVDRHESLRTNFITVAGDPKQKVHPEQKFKLDYYDLRDEVSQEKVAKQMAEENATQPFDLESDLLFRVSLIHLAENRYQLLLAMHHIIADGWSMDIFKNEFDILYEAYKNEQPNPLEPQPLQYKDFTIWQNRSLKEGKLVAERDYWLKHLEQPLQVLNLPWDTSYHSQSNDRRGGAYQLLLPLEVQEQLHRLAQTKGVSLSAVMLAGYTVYLSRLTREKDIVFAGPITGRSHENVKNIIGLFINTVLYRNQVNWEESFEQLLEQVQVNLLSALDAQSYPFDLLVDELQLNRELNQPSVTSVFFNMLNFTHAGSAQLENMQTGHLQLAQQMKFDFGCYFTETERGIVVLCEYRTALFKDKTIEYMMKEFAHFFSEIATDGQKPIEEYDLFSKKRVIPPKRQVTPMVPYQEFTKEEINQSIPARFEKQVQQYPERIAVKTRDEELTYRELNRVANGVAHAILQKGDQTNRLTKDERIRYGRQMMLHGWGLDAQEKLKQTKVFAAGAGGSGSPMITQLALLGFGTIGICDPDEVDLSNLNRQFLHDNSRIGMNKALSGKLTVERINPHVEVIAQAQKITRENVAELVGDADIIFDNVDDLEAKFVLSEYAVAKGIPHIISSMMDINAYAAIFHTPKTPCFHCLYDRRKLEEMEEIQRLSNQKKTSNPVSSPALFLSTGFACNEAVKIVLGFENPAYNKYFLFNQRASKEIVHTNGYIAITYPFSEHFKRLSNEQGFDWGEGWRGQFVEELTLRPNPECPVCGQVRAEREVATVQKDERNHFSASAATFKTNLEQQTVALLFEHGADMIVGMLGALKAGQTYVPLDPNFPEERLIYMLEDSNASLLVTNTKNLAYANRLFGQVTNYIKLLNIDIIDENVDWKNLQISNQPDQLAYILYTSGSTGHPKGVMQSQRNVLHFIQTYTNNLHINTWDRLSLFSSYSFDASVMDIYGALLNGATLYPYNIKEANSLTLLADWLMREKITIYHSVPTVYRYFIEILTGEEYFPDLRLLVMGGEALFKTDLESFKRHFTDQTILINGLGPTESTVTLQYFMDKNTTVTDVAIPVGYPVAETEVMLLDEQGREVPVFGVGEMVFKSPYLALGYWQRPEQTKRAFRLDPQDEMVRSYHSGDLGQRLPDGSICFVGRKDDQVKVRGYRIELNEIEMNLDHLTGVQKSAVVAAPKANGEKALIAYYLPQQDQQVAPETIKAELKKRLPEYMQPEQLILLEKMPLTPTGKINRKALPAISGELVSKEREYQAPRNALEEKLVMIWSEVLGEERIGITDHFFELGGHSLKAIMLAGQLNKQLNVEVPIREIFKHPTIAGLSQYLQGRSETVYQAIGKVAEKEYYQVSSAQKRMYMLQQFDLQSTRYNMSGVLEVEGPLDLKKVETVFARLVRRHETLRTSFITVKGIIMQKVHDKVELLFEKLEIAVGETVETRIQAFIRPFDLSQAPLMRVGVIPVGHQRHILIFDMHHIISDGTSSGILINEFANLYNGKELSQLSIQYKDYAEWQDQQLASDYLHQQKEYWIERLSDPIPVLNLPTDYPRSTVQSLEGDSITFSLEENLTIELQRIAQETSSTLYMVLLAGINILLAKYSGQDDIIVGSPIAGRPHADLEKIIGMFVNTLAMRNHPDGNKTYEEFLAEVRTNALGAYENQDYQFEELVDQLNLRRDLSRNPLFDVMFVMQNMNQGEVELQDIKITPYDYKNQTSKFDLTISAMEAEGIIAINLQYCTQLFKRETIQRMISHLKNILQIVATNSQISLGQIEMLTSAEKNQILHEFNNTTTDYPKHRTIHELFREQVERNPDQIAVVFEDLQLTYRELDEKSNSLAAQLREQGVEEDTLIGIMAEKSLEMVIGVMAILKAGGAYLPIDPDYPKDRIQFMLADCSVDILFTQGQLTNGIDFNGTRIDLLDEKIYLTCRENLSNINNPANLAYVIYTSGSTGKSKGVMVTHQNVVRLVKNTNYIELQPGDKVLQTGTLAFDASTFEIWGSLLNGLELHLGRKDLILRTEELADYLITHQINNLFLTTALFNLLAEERPDLFRPLKVLLTGGEAASAKHFNKVRQACPELKIANIYGPTENTTFSAYYFINRDDSGNIPIGNFISNTTGYVVDQNGHLAPIGVYGELFLGGDGLARGYLNRPELTAEKFVTDRFGLSERMYRTGDLVRWLPDGNIEFIGRIDHQVKIRGFRIEPGEIENCLSNHQEIKEIIVVDGKDEQGNKYLSAYFVAQREMSVGEVREYLSNHLPEYMIPACYMQLEKLPLNKNGKIDRQALPKLEGQVATGTEYVAPSNEIEAKLALIWSDILAFDPVGIHDNFFELGGHSLKATTLISKIHKGLDVEVPLSEIFKKPTIKELAVYIEKSEQNHYLAIQPVKEKAYYETSSAQKRMYMLQQLDPNSINYNIPGVFRVEGKLDLARLEVVFRSIIERHESLRTSFEILDEQVLQKIHPHVGFSIEYLENVISIDQSVEEMVHEFVQPFDLSQAPLFRVRVVSLAEDECIIIFDMHHIISDGTSMAILINEVTKLYAGQKLDALRIQYKDVAEWQEQLRQSEVIKEQETYWLNQFAAEIPVLTLPTDYPRPTVQSLEGDSITCRLDPVLTRDLQQIAQETGSTLYMVLLAGVNILLAKYSGQEEIIVGSPIAGRPHADLEKIIGMFVNTLAMHNRPIGEKTYAEFLAEVRANALTAFENQDYQFEELVERLHLNRDLSRNPLFDVMFVMQNMEVAHLEVADVRFIPFEYENRTAKFDLTFAAIGTDEEILLHLQYCTQLFKRETVTRMITHLIQILKLVSADSQIQLREIDLLTTEEKEKLLYIFNDTKAAFPEDKTIQQLFAEQVARNVDQIAVVYQDQRLTYGELDERSNALAHLLRANGVQEDTLVGVIAEKSLEMIIGVMAILKSGGAYLPIDPEYPKDRIKYMLQDSSVEILLTLANFRSGFDFDGSMIDLNEQSIYETNAGIIENLNNSRSLAYVIYTSGSTGNPKGVMIEHRNIVRLVKNTDYDQFADGDKVLQAGTLSFDASTFEVWGALLNGLELHLGSKDLILHPKTMGNYLLENQITTILLTTPLFNFMAEERPDIFRTLKYLFVGGDVISPGHVNKVKAVCGDLQIINGYGPTENTTFSTYYPIGQSDVGEIPIGKPIHNSTAFVLDRDNNLAPIGVYGELCVGGSGLARGYLNRPELTAEKFVEHPLLPGEIIYRTGDLVRWLPDGNIQFAGRIDQQVKIRGFRIELSGIVVRLLEIAEIKEAVVIDRKDKDGNKYLVAYLVTDSETIPELEELRESLSRHLPDYMIPSHFVQLEKIPLTRNGKVDRNALPMLEGNVSMGIGYEAPRNLLETKLATIWGEVLGLEKVGVNDNFFTLGGHSLKATVLVSKLHKALNVEIPLSEFFRRPTIKELAKYVEILEENIYSSIQPVEEKVAYQASSAQKRMYMLQQFKPNSISYNIPAIFIVQGNLDLERLEIALSQLVVRHESLRTCFATENNQVVQKIVPATECAIEYDDALNISDQKIEEIVSRFVRPFDLSQALLFRVGVIRLTNDHWILMFDMHHIISDGTSVGILVQEFTDLYQGKKLEELRIQYKDVAEWQQQLLTSEIMYKQKEYWHNRFDDELPVLNLPTDYPRPAVLSLEGETIEFTLGEELTRELAQITQTTGSTMYMVLLAGVNILFSKYSGQEDIMVGSPIAGRPHADLEKIIGMFVNTLVMRNKPTGEKSYLQFLTEVRATALEAYENQDYQFEELVEQLNMPRDLSRNPLFDVMFAMQNMNQNEFNLDDLTFLPYKYANQTSKFDLTITASEVGDEIRCHLEYSSKLFKRETMERMILHLNEILKEVVVDQEIRLSEIDMITVPEKEILSVFNDTYTDYPRDKVIHELFEEQVKRVPEQIAVCYENQQLTYRELNAKANRLARTLREQGVQAGSIVGIMVDRSLEMMVGILGILKAGGAYLPINSSYPMERVHYMLEDSGALLLLTHEYLLPTLDSELYSIFLLEDVTIYHETATNLEPLQQPEDMAYVIYTSGSTGKPKGVMIPHRALNNFVFSMYQSLDEKVGVADRCLSLTNISFDVSVCEIFMPLTFGATLVLFHNEIVPDIQKLGRIIIKEEITFAYIPPMILPQVYQQLAQAEVKLNKLLVGVEPIKDYVLEDYLSLHPKMQILNGYGPTEATICATFYHYGQIASTGKNVPIGQPLANTQIYLLDSNLRPVPVGVAGELCIAGDGLAIGYLNRKELTVEKFVTNPFILGTRMYRTGDLARWLPDGNVEFLGRIDQQVKIRGFRIEPGEIENQLLQYELIQDAIAIAREDEYGIKYLVAYLVADQDISVSNVREYLLETLPEYMIPSYFVQLDQMPLTANGKIDRRALPEPVGNIVVGTSYEAPSNLTEEALVAIWKEVLGIDRIGINDNFFELGGHSLKATVLVTKIHQELNVDMPLSEVFKRSTIKELAQYVVGLEETLYSAIQPVGEQDHYPASSAQKRIYLQCQFEDIGLSYNMPGAVVIEGKLNLERFEQVFKQLVDRHETLRTSFEIIDGEVIQKVCKHVEFAIDFMEVDQMEVPEILAHFLHPFDLKVVPLIRVALAQLSEDRYLMCFDLHHIISDGVSMENLINEFISLYQGRELPELRIQYKDFAVWQNELFQTEVMENQEKYWLETFVGEIPVLNMPTDYPRPSVQSFTGCTLCTEVDEELLVQLRELAVETGSTLYMVLLAAFNLLLYKYTGQEDLVIGSPVAGRGHADLQKIIGMFVNMLALRNAPSGDMSFGEFLSEVKKNTLLALDHQDYQFEELVEKLKLRRDLSRNPLFDVVFALKNVSGQSVEETDDLRFIPYNFESSISQFDLTFEVVEEMDRMWISLEYCTDLFNKNTMERLSSHYINILREITNDHDLKLIEVNILSKAERKQLLEDFNDTEMEFARDKTLHQLVQEQVEQTPDRVAMVFEDERLTYQELNTKANQLAYQLRELGLERDQIVAIMVERSIEMIIGMLAVLKAGGAYMPIDPDYPVERMIYMLEDSQTQILLIHNGYIDEIEYNGKIIDLADRVIYTGDGSNLNNINKPKDLAYVMYTSGSTGKPKGVMIEHQAIVSLSKYYNQMFKLDQKKNILHLSNVSFDTSVVEIYPPLIYGATVYVIRKELALDREKFIQFVRENQIHFAQFVPMMLQEILAQSERLEGLETVIVGGDRLDDSLKDQILSLDYQLTNHYGPTEATVDAIVARCVKGKGTIGKPIANTLVYILDQDNNVTPIGIPGELCISGVGLARGYLNRPELTAEKFVHNPFVSGERMYRTGDLACWQPDGSIIFLGRIDNQVKIRGYRIELGEIEEQLLKHQEVTGAVVVDKVDGSGSKYLCAYVVADEELTAVELRTYLGRELPDYMIPSYFMQIERIPATHNGKVDRQALPEPDGRMETDVEYVAPTNEIEKKLITIWQEVLGIEGIGTGHNFFELGGHSLKVTVLVAKIHKELNVKVPLSEVFKNPTVKELAQYIQKAEENVYAFIDSVETREYYPVSSSQRRLYIQWQLEVDSRSYNMPSAIILKGELDRFKLEKAIQALGERHEAFRTFFEMVDGEPVQKILDQIEISILYLKIDGKKVSDLVEQFIQPFDLSQAPLLRIALIQLARNEHLMFFDMHHIISDGVSMEILNRDFASLYAGGQLPPLQVQYKDYAIWHNKLMEAPIMQKSNEYWMKKLEYPIYTELPVSMVSSDGESKARTRTVLLNQDLIERTNAFCLEHKMTKFVFLLGVFKIIVMKAINQDDITLGIPVAGRKHEELEKIIGVFLNVMVMRTQIDKEAAFKDYLLNLRNDLLEAQEHQDYPYELLYGQIKDVWNFQHNSLFSILFNYMPYQGAEDLELDGISIQPYKFEEIEPKYSFTLYVNEGRDQISLDALFSSNLEEGLIEVIMDSFPAMIEEFLSKKNMLIKEVNLVGDKHLNQYVEEFDMEFDNDDFF